MKHRLISTLAILGAFVSAGSFAPLAAQGSIAPAISTASGPSEELKPIIASIKDKMKAGMRTEADLAGEIARLDALLAKYPNQKTEEVANILVLKISLFLQVFQDYDKCLVLLNQMKTDFPATKAAQDADDLIPKIQQLVESQKVADALKPGSLFPVFSEQDMSGKPLTLESFRGHVVMIDFWATWCGPCVAEFPNVLAAYEKYHSKGFDIVGISLDHDKTALVNFMADKKVTWPQYFDGKGWQNELARRYGVISIPASYLLDKEGRIIAVGLRGPALDAKLAALLGS